jgi:hypothetical protein
MALKSILQPSQAVAVGIGISALDLLIFDHFVPSVADVRTAAPQNSDVETARRQATIYCVGINGLVSLMTRDWNVFLIGGMTTAAMSWLIVHANTVNPVTGTMKSPGEQAQSDSNGATNENMYPLADYSDMEQAS